MSLRESPGHDEGHGFTGERIYVCPDGCQSLQSVSPLPFQEAHLPLMFQLAGDLLLLVSSPALLQQEVAHQSGQGDSRGWQRADQGNSNSLTQGALSGSAVFAACRLLTRSGITKT